MTTASRVTGIRYIGYGVADFDAEAAYYSQKWGLEQLPSADGMAWFKTQGHDEHHVVRLRKSDENRVDVIALAAESRGDIDALATRVAAAGAQIVHGPRELTTPGGGYGFHFFSPDGIQLEISSDVARGTCRQLKRWDGVPVKISHIVLHSPDHKALAAFFCDVLGFKISDWLGDFMCFLRCNSAHHRIALLPGPACLNHVAYDMLTVDDVMRGIHRLKQQGVNIGWGPGRHTAGNNTFSYFTTPSGFVTEFTSDLEEVDFESREPTVYTPSAMVMDQWGVGTGGPQSLPRPQENAGLFVAVAA